MGAVPPHLVRAMSCGILGLCALVYANTLVGEFIWDDVSSILLHEHVQDPATLTQLFTEDQHAFAGGQGNFYRPLLAVTFMFDFWLSNNGPTIMESPEVITQLSPFIFHLDSILWHALACIALLFLLRNLDASTPVQVALPLIYAIHPLHTEAVTYISGRADSMSAAFILSGLAFATAVQPRRPALFTGLTLICFMAGLLSKESTLIFPVLLILTLIAANKIHAAKFSPRQGVVMIGSGLILVLYAVLRSGPLNFGSGSAAPESTFAERMVETVQSFAYYIELMIAPSSLHMERTLVNATTMTTVFGALILLALIVSIGIRLQRRQYRIALGAAWFLTSWLPISGIFPLNAPMAEHWMYVPMVGFLLVLLSVLFEVIPAYFSTRTSQRVQAVFGIVVMIWGVSLTFVSIERNADWRTNRSIYEATIRENPDTTRVNYNLAVTHQYDINNPVGAKRHYTSIINAYATRKAELPSDQHNFWDEEIQSHLSMGQLYVDEAQYGDAIRHFQLVASIVPDDRNKVNVGQALMGLGKCVLATGDRAQADKLFAQAVQHAPQLQPEINSLF